MPETAVAVAAAAADDAEAGCVDWNWVHQSADVLLVEGDEVACVASGDVVVEVGAGVAAEVVRAGESTAVEPAAPVDGDRRVGPWAEAP